MRILFWTGMYPPYIGGLEVFGQQLVQALCKRGHEIIIIASHREQPLPNLMEVDGVQVYRYHFQAVMQGQNPARIIATRNHIAAVKKAFKPDIIHLNSFDFSGFFHARTANVATCPTLFTVHSTFKFSVEVNSMFGRMLRDAVWVNTVSKAMLDDLRREVPEAAARSSVIHNSLRFPDLQPTTPRFDLPRLLCMGRVVEDKGFDVALDAFAELIVEFPSARLILAGDGGVLLDLKMQAQRLGIHDNVEWLGWVAPEKIPQIINDASLVLMPSRWREPFGLVALQAAQMARPIVASNVGGIPEIVVDGETGLLVEPDDSHALAQAAASIMRDPTAAERMGSAALLRAENVFSFEHMVDEYENLYRKLTQG
jgi:glycogen synthase